MLVEERGDELSGEVPPAVALEDEGRAVLVEEGAESGDGGFGGCFEDGPREELVAAPEVADGEDPAEEAVDGTGRFGVVDGPDGAGAGPLELVDEEGPLAEADLAEAREDRFELAPRDVGERAAEAVEARAGADRGDEGADLDALPAVDDGEGTAAELRDAAVAVFPGELPGAERGGRDPEATGDLGPAEAAAFTEPGEGDCAAAGAALPLAPGPLPLAAATAEAPGLGEQPLNRASSACPGRLFFSPPFAAPRAAGPLRSAPGPPS